MLGSEKFIPSMHMVWNLEQVAECLGTSVSPAMNTIIGMPESGENCGGYPWVLLGRDGPSPQNQELISYPIIDTEACCRDTCGSQVSDR